MNERIGAGWLPLGTPIARGGITFYYLQAVVLIEEETDSENLTPAANAVGEPGTTDET